MKQKKIPMRMCVGCRVMQPKKQMTRVVRGEDGAIVIDSTGKAPGRGAYLCATRTCLERAMKGHLLERALECHVSGEVYERLHEAIARAEGMHEE